MSAREVSQIIASNHAPFDATLWLIHLPTAAYRLEPQLDAGDKEVRFDLTTIRGLSDGMTFYVRVISGQGIGADDLTILTYMSDSRNAGVYDITGIAFAPRISFEYLEPI
ncbi:hypothetical protein GYMLUDRAFT_248387 [Collybiopsis luxurians FD-317 M1]|uniref:Uncharacterized protein n=1 Tax=Collybiopsis luxurians FD-317 M1 TaxID=944289 RepID=A0A0D0C0E1_9AGAR|nr:hypothetical protein GYMLUDRAFT_248387 [Collybiopsis luxurians FD-317 M1]